VRKVLVCVRTVAAAQNITSAAARLGLSADVRTAVSEPEVMLRLSERPAEIVLADTALARPDSASFTRRVLARSPGTVIVLFGAEDPRVASAAVAAGARGLIRGADDLVSVVAKTLLLLAISNRVASRIAPGPGPGPVGEVPSGMPAKPATGLVDSNGGPAVVPVQREDKAAQHPPVGGERCEPPVATEARLSDTIPSVGPAAALRRIGLTERELQVLRGMAEGKSNGEIGRELFVSEDTVKTHARRLFRKLGARDRAHAVATGFRTGLVA